MANARAIGRNNDTFETSSQIFFGESDKLEDKSLNESEVALVKT